MTMQAGILRRFHDVFLGVAFAVAALLTVLARPASAEGERVIAVPKLHAMTPEAGDDAALLTSALRARFHAMPSLRVVEEPVPMASPGHPDILLPQFEKSRDLHFDLVLVGNAALLSDGRHKVSLRIWNVEKQTQLLGQQYVFRAYPGHEQEIANVIGDALVSALSQ
ncbi:hypothetical protein [Bradyrhizobium sp. SZCCHNS3052]|uniref:hypothetical protein n=1 Tax=Bradyrhizobium sp. SZCCHNS3052 TaxID=3057321 RepID=UPI0039673A5A